MNMNPDTKPDPEAALPEDEVGELLQLDMEDEQELQYALAVWLDDGGRDYTTE